MQAFSIKLPLFGGKHNEAADGYAPASFEFIKIEPPDLVGVWLGQASGAAMLVPFSFDN